MNSNVPEKSWLVRYLLGDVPEEEAHSFELRYFSDPAALEILDLAETELIDAYLNSDLDPEQHKLFEERFLTGPKRRARVEIERSLRRHYNVRKMRRWFEAIPGGARHWAALVACGLFLTGVGLVSTQSIQWKRQNQQLRIALEKRNGSTVTVALATTTRDSIRSPHRIPPDAFLVEFVLPQPDALHRATRVALHLPEDPEAVWSQERLPATDSGILIPAMLFEDADYILALYGEAKDGSPVEVAAYSFRITRR